MLKHTAALVAPALVACATLPSDPVERALYVDLRKGTELGEDAGWVVDRLEIDSQMESAMRSICQVERETRLRLETWLDGQVALAGGPAEQQYRTTRDLSAATAALQLEHVRAVLRYGNEGAAEDCPFWLEPDPEFSGTQGDADRIVLLAESGGFGAVVFEGSEAAIGGGGYGRLLVGHGFGPSATLALGAEVGGTGAFVESDSGSARSLETKFTAALPVLLRLSRFSRVLDFEVAPVFRIAESEDPIPPGVATSVGLGLTTMRASVWMPYVVLWTGYAYHPPRDGGVSDHSIRIGTRVGIDVDP